MNDAWIAGRMRHIDASGIRKAFDMARSMKDPINLSIGLPDFEVAGPVKLAAIEAIEHDFHAYTQTQGIPELRARSRPPSTPSSPTPTARSSSPRAPPGRSCWRSAAWSTPATR